MTGGFSGGRMGFGIPKAVSYSLLLAAAYYVSARLGLRLQFQETQATPFWPPSGIALAALFLFGARLGGGVFLGAFLANLADFYVKSRALLPVGGLGLLQHLAGHPEHIVISAGIGLGNTLEAVAGSYLVRRFVVGSDIFQDIRNILWFILWALICCIIAATIGVCSLFAGAALPYPLLSTTWVTWWLGDATGILIFTPLVLAWSRLGRDQLRAQPWGRMAAALLLLFLLCQFTFNAWFNAELSGLSRYLFDGWLDLTVLFTTEAYMLIPVLLWIEFGFGTVAATLGIAITAGIAVVGTVNGRGPFLEATQNESLLVLQGFLGVMSITVLVLDAALRERRRALGEVTRAHDELELRIRERTAQLSEANDELSLKIRERNLALARLEQETAERRRTEEILHQSQKMEVLGQLTGGIAHDFNNLLHVIFGSIETLQRRLKTAAPELRQPIDMALRSSEKAATLTQRLLAFSRRQPLQPKPVDLNGLVAGMSDLLRRALGESVAVETVLGGGLWSVFVDPSQLESAVLNLAVNARDAMPEGGKLTLETANVFLDESYAAAQAEVAAGPYVMIAVSDTGIGMTAEVIAKAFEPFFTTKEHGKGTGLGLSQVYGFIKQSGGHLKIYSEPGDGTTVKLYLPRLATGEPRERMVDVQPIPTGTPKETILLVEDNEDVRVHSAEMLGELGYRVVTAPDGPTALGLLEAEHAIRLLFTDLGLPGGVNGRQLAEEARRRDPGLKVLFTTGYAQNAVVHRGRLDPGVALITKPFTYAALAAKVRDILAQTAQAEG